VEIIKPGTVVDFVSKMKNAVFISIALIVISIISLCYHKGLNWGVEFIGGTEVHIKFTKDISTVDIKNKGAEINYSEVSVQSLGLQSDNEYIISFSSDDVNFNQIPEFQKQLKRLVNDKNGGKFQGASIQRIDFIGPKVGKELIRKAIFSIIFGWLGILLYVMIRFELGFAIGAVIAIIHDIIITLCAISLLDKEFNLAIVAAFLTVIGYSVNDTIVIFDRIRENLKKGYSSFSQLINESVSQTLSRTILTSVTALIVLLCLFIFGGSVIHDFAYTLIVGVIVGTYSSIFVATTFVVYWNNKKAL